MVFEWHFFHYEIEDFLLICSVHAAHQHQSAVSYPSYCLCGLPWTMLVVLVVLVVLVILAVLDGNVAGAVDAVH